MNAQLSRLFTIASSPSRRILGLMAGTSLDGLDMALCRIEGSGRTTRVTLERFATAPFEEAVKEKIRQVFAKKNIDFQQLTLLNAWLGRHHAGLVCQQLADWGESPATVDLIASHGQTVFHAPRILHGLPDYPNATLQIADGDHLAVHTGIITLSDFRQKHVAAGGEGAPLAVYGDYFIFTDVHENRILLNLGGIANFTYLPANGMAEEVFVTDTGPGNTLLDAFAQAFTGLPYDQDGQLSLAGSVSRPLLQALKADAFFQAPFPRTTGPELFNISYVQRAQQRSDTSALSAQDLMATLSRFTAETVAEAVLKACRPGLSYHLYLSGGGMHNPSLVQNLQDCLPGFTMKTTDVLGISGDAKEAVLFAVLANETIAGGEVFFGNRPGVPSVSMGKISFPA